MAQCHSKQVEKWIAFIQLWNTVEWRWKPCDTGRMRGDPKVIRMAADLEDEDTRARAIAKIARAFTKAEGNAVRASEALGVPHRTVMRWRQRYDELEAKVAAIREEFGHRHRV